MSEIGSVIFSPNKCGSRFGELCFRAAPLHAVSHFEFENISNYVLKKNIFKALSWDLPVLCPFDSLQPVYVVDRKLVNIYILTKNLQCALC